MRKTKEVIKKHYFLFSFFILTIVGGFLRFNKLGDIKKYIFDEVYYVKDAKHLWKYGHEQGFVVHPPFGKWLIGLSEHLFTGSFGWRFMSALCGTLCVPLIILLTKKLFNNNVVAIFSGLILCADGMNIVMSRVAMLDVFLCFFGLLSVYFFALFLEKPNVLLCVLTGISVGLCGSCKIIGLILIPFFIAVLLYRKKYLQTLWLFLSATITYLLTYAGWFFTHNGYGRYFYINNAFGSRNLISKTFTALGSFVMLQKEMIVSAIDITSKHTYMSPAYQWFFNIRPTQLYSEQLQCKIGSHFGLCIKDIVALNNPFIWTISLIVFILLIIVYVKKRTFNLLLILVPVVLFYIPWFFVYKRTVFEFYAVSFSPYIACLIPIAISFVKSKYIKTSLYVSLAIIILVSTVYFYPIWTGSAIGYDAWNSRMWFENWI